MRRLLSGEQRLPGFKDDWELHGMESIGTFLKGKGIPKSSVTPSGVPCIRYGQIYTSEDHVKTKFCSFTSAAEATLSTSLCGNDLLLAGSGETAEEIGKAIAYAGTEEAVAGGDIIVFRPVEGVDGAFLSFYLNTVGRSKLRRLGQGQSVVHIYSRDLSAVEVPLPSLEEQRAIVKLLLQASDDVKLIQRRADALRAQKKFLLNNLVTGAMRLPQFVQGEPSTGKEGSDE